MSTPAVTCRVPDPVDERIGRAAEEREMMKSEVVRRALRFYMDENPDEIAAFGGGDARERQGAPGPVVAAVDGDVGGEDDPDADDAESDGDTLSAGVYDPTEEC